MRRTNTLIVLASAVALGGCVTSTAIRQAYRGPATGGKTVEIGGKLNSLTGTIEITAEGQVIANARATPVLGSSSELSGEYNGKPVRGQCIEVPVETRKLLGHTMTRCHVTIAGDRPIVIELWNDSKF